MHDLRAIRNDPEAYDLGWVARGLAPKSREILAMDETVRAAQTALQAAQSDRNDLSRQIGQARSAGEAARAQSLMAQVETLKTVIAENTLIESTVGQSLRDLLAALPNIPDPDTPPGEDETGNIELRRWGEPFTIANAKDHVDLGVNLGMMDFEAAGRMSGARFVVLKDGLARLERALGQFMMDFQTQEHGYTEVSPPLLVRDGAMFGTGQLPKFAEESFQTTQGHWLIPTAEVSLTNMVRDQIIAEEMLPLRLTALTPCFRSEAGASGKDTRGMIRQHQF